MKMYDLFITLKNGDVYKINDAPCPLNDYCENLLFLTKPSIYGNNIVKFEIIECCVNATER